MDPGCALALSLLHFELFLRRALCHVFAKEVVSARSEGDRVRKEGFGLMNRL